MYAIIGSNGFIGKALSNRLKEPTICIRSSSSGPVRLDKDADWLPEGERLGLTDEEVDAEALPEGLREGLTDEENRLTFQ